MVKKYKKALFIFRRDLRLKDNNGLRQALCQAEQVIPCFIFDERQVGDTNKYRSLPAVHFMVASLQALDEELRRYGSSVYCFYGNSEEIIEMIITHHTIDALFFNEDYTPFSKNRDENIHTVCKKNGVISVQTLDTLLCDPRAMLTKAGTPIKLFAHFLKASIHNHVPEPHVEIQENAFFKGDLSGSHSIKHSAHYIKTDNCSDPAVIGGRDKGLVILDSLSSFHSYQRTRDYPAYATTHLSAHLKFGTVSIREVYHAARNKLVHAQVLLQELVWRDFFTHITFHFPHVLGHAFYEKYERLAWDNKKPLFHAWCQGLTGFPLVDAGMRELNTTGFMHNRVRMVTASLLVKDFLIDWRLGERYFAQKLIDYDPAVNNGNWQWIAGTGSQSQPYFRIFNPWQQQKKYDPQALYIKKWVPELASLEPKLIHRWYDQTITVAGYPKPLVDHAFQKGEALALYKNMR